MDEQLHQAVRTLTAILRRYETEQKAEAGYVRAHNMHIVLGYADMLWIAAAIEALKKAADSRAS